MSVDMEQGIDLTGVGDVAYTEIIGYMEYSQ